MSGSNKFNFNTSGLDNKSKTNKIIHLGVVESTLDESDGGRIKVRVKGVDDHIGSTVELPYAFPMLQKFVHIIPQIGESVWIMFPDTTNPYEDRLYLGPIISQPQKLKKDHHGLSSTSTLGSIYAKPGPAPSTIPESQGVFPKNKDFAIQGRENTDVVFKDSEVLIRAGKFIKNDSIKGVPKFNKKNPSYIQIKQIQSPDVKLNGVINVVSNKINLLTHQDGSPRFNLSDQNTMISDEELGKIQENAHPLVFGDLLIEYLELFKNALTNHVHPYNGMKPEDLAGHFSIKKFLEYDVSKIICKNIKIN